MGIQEYRERINIDRAMQDIAVAESYANLTERELKLRTQMGALVVIKSIEQTVGLTSNRGISFVERVFDELTAPELMGYEMPVDQGGYDDRPRSALDLVGSLLEGGLIDLNLDRSIRITDTGASLLVRKATAQS